MSDVHESKAHKREEDQILGIESYQYVTISVCANTY